MRHLEQLVKRGGFTDSLAYHDPRWRRDKAPLLDHLGAVIDHVEAYSRGGKCEEGNFVTACNKCNGRKSNAPATNFTARSPLLRIKGKYGEPTDWDGLSRLFLMLAQQDLQWATPSELEWLRALRGAGQPLDHHPVE